MRPKLAQRLHLHSTLQHVLRWVFPWFISFSAEAAVHEVGVFDYFFEPFQLSIQAGDTVTWTAYGFGHTVISDTRLFDSSRAWGSSIPALRTYQFTFHEPGVYPYYSLDYGGPEGSGMSATITVTGAPSNQVPAGPVAILPTPSASNQVIHIDLRASAFQDGDAGDTHLSSQWVVRRATDNEIVYDSGPVFDNGANFDSKTNRFLPAGLLHYGASYSWQVRYRDSYGAWSEYSAPAAFSTLPPRLRIARQSNAVFIAWPTNSGGFVLMTTTTLSSSNWSAVALTPQRANGENVVSNHVAENRLFRLSKP